MRIYDKCSSFFCLNKKKKFYNSHEAAFLFYLSITYLLILASSSLEQVSCSSPSAAPSTLHLKDDNLKLELGLDSSLILNKNLPSDRETNSKKVENHSSISHLKPSSSSSNTQISSQKIDTKKENEAEELKQKQMTINNMPLFSLEQNRSAKYCADFASIKHLMSAHVQPLIDPIVHLLPYEMQTMLDEETEFLGLSKASCIFMCILFAFFTSTWFTLVRMSANSKTKLNYNLNESIVSLSNKLNECKFQNQTFLNLINEQRIKLSDADSDRGELVELREKYQTLKSEQAALETSNRSEKSKADLLAQELSGLKQKCSSQESAFESQLTKLNDELDSCKNALEMRLAELSDKQNELDLLKSENQRLDRQRNENEETIEILKHSLMTNDVNGKSWPIDLAIEKEQDESDADRRTSVETQSIVKLARLQMRIKELEEKLSDFDLLNEKLSSKELKLKENERVMRDLEMQIKLMVELREKDTKQHLKALSEMDAKLKKKSTEAAKCTHLLEQLRIKQERIQHLESEYARVERQSNQERQTYEKQAHENWLNGRKLEKDFKEAKQELSLLRDRFVELNNENSHLKQQQQQQHQHNIMMINQQKLAVPLSTNPSSSFYFNLNPNKNNNSSLNADEMRLNENFNESSLLAQTHTDAVSDLPLQIDTMQAATMLSSEQRPPSSSSSTTSQPFQRVFASYAQPPQVPIVEPHLHPLAINAAACAAAAALYHQKQQQYQQQKQQQQQQLESPSMSSPNPDYVKSHAASLSPFYNQQQMNNANMMMAAAAMQNQHNNSMNSISASNRLSVNSAPISIKQNSPSSPHANSTTIMNAGNSLANNTNNQMQNSFLNETNISFSNYSNGADISSHYNNQNHEPLQNTNAQKTSKEQTETVNVDQQRQANVTHNFEV